MDRKTKLILNLLAVAVLGLFILLVKGNLDGYKIQILNLIAINIILALSLNLIYGFTGMFSLGHAGFMAIGAYVCSILIMTPDQKEMLFILEAPYPWVQAAQAPFFVAVLLGGFIAAITGIIVGIPLLRLGDDYLGIATLGFAEIVRVFANNLPRLTNGALGFKGVPDYANIWWNFGWCLLTLYFVMRIVNSNFGNTLKAIRDDETAAKAMGINVFKHKMISFTMGAFFAGVGGALLGSLLTTIDPKMFLFVLTFNILMIVVTGGLGSITGSVLGGHRHHHPARMAALCGEPHQYRRFLHRRGAGYAHGGLFPGPAIDHPVSPRGTHGNPRNYLGRADRMGRQTR